MKKAIPLIPPREGAAFWEKGHPRNLAVGCQKLYGSNKKWKQKYGYLRRPLSETAMYREKQLLGASLSLRNYNAQVGGDLRHDQSTQQVNWDRYARSSIYRLKGVRFS